MLQFAPEPAADGGAAGGPTPPSPSSPKRRGRPAKAAAGSGAGSTPEDREEAEEAEERFGEAEQLLSGDDEWLSLEEQAMPPPRLPRPQLLQPSAAAPWARDGAAASAAGTVGGAAMWVRGPGGLHGRRGGSSSGPATTSTGSVSKGHLEELLALDNPSQAELERLVQLVYPTHRGPTGGGAGGGGGPRRRQAADGARVPLLLCVRQEEPAGAAEVYELPVAPGVDRMDEQTWAELPEHVRQAAHVGSLGPGYCFSLCAAAEPPWFSFLVEVEGGYSHAEADTLHPCALHCGGRRRHNARHLEVCVRGGGGGCLRDDTGRC